MWRWEWEWGNADWICLLDLILCYQSKSCYKTKLQARTSWGFIKCRNLFAICFRIWSAQENAALFLKLDAWNIALFPPFALTKRNPFVPNPGPENKNQNNNCMTQHYNGNLIYWFGRVWQEAMSQKQCQQKLTFKTFGENNTLLKILTFFFEPECWIL